MPLFRYLALSREGKEVKGTIDATSLQSARESLQAQRLMPVSITLAETMDRGGLLAGLFAKKVDTKTKIRYTKQLAVLLASGVPLVKAVELLAQQFEGKMRFILLDVKDRLQGGTAYAEALGTYPKVFSSVYVQLVRAGEASGKLGAILERLTLFLERAEDTRKQIRKALAYPIMLLSITGIVVIGMLVFLVPQFVEMFSEMGGGALPGPTQFLKTVSDVVSNYYLPVFGGIAAVILFLMYWGSTERGSIAIDRFMLRFPLTAYFSKTRVVVEFSKTLGMLLASGVNLAEALDIVCNIIDNKVLTGTLKAARDKIIKEGKIAHYLKETAIFPPIASYMISTGEESGELADMLLTVGSDYERELTDIIDKMIATINPIMLVIVGGIIGFVIIAMFLPVFEMMGTIGQELTT